MVQFAYEYTLLLCSSHRFQPLLLLQLVIGYLLGITLLEFACCLVVRVYLSGFHFDLLLEGFEAVDVLLFEAGALL